MYMETQTHLIQKVKVSLNSSSNTEGRKGGGGGEVSRVTCLNFKRSCVCALSMIGVAVTVAVGNLKKGCRLSQFHPTCKYCRYFSGHVACWNLPWQSLYTARVLSSFIQVVNRHKNNLDATQLHLHTCT